MYIVYNAIAQNWVKEGSDPGNAEWRESDLQFRCPSNLSQADKLFLMLVRLRLDLKVYDLAKGFELSESSYFPPGLITITSIWVCYHAGLTVTQLGIPCLLFLKNNTQIKQPF